MVKYYRSGLIQKRPILSPVRIHRWQLDPKYAPIILKVAMMAALILGAFIFTGCSQDGTQPITSTPAETMIPDTATPLDDELAVDPTPTQETGHSDYDPALEPFVQAAKEDLSSRLNISPVDIEVIAAGAVVWPDASAGCPKPGVAYIQVQEEGIVVQLAYQGKKFEYHRSESRPLFLCEITVE